MTLKPLSIALLSTCLLAAAPHSGAQQVPLELSLVRGGAVYADPVSHGDLVYMPTGRTIATWAYDDPAAPLHLADSAPVGGVINGLALYGDHLYASWRGHDSSGGIAVWSLADPLNPELVYESEDYHDGDRRPFGIAAANGHLYLFDNDHGMFVADLANPEHPQLTIAIAGALLQYTRVAVHGDIIHATGRNFGDAAVLDLYDISAPADPFRIASHAVDGLDSYTLVTEPDRAIGVGNRLTIFDLADPAAMEPRGSIDIPPAIAGASIGSHAYTFGWGSGLGIWDISDVDAPEAAGHLDIPTYGGNRLLETGGHLLLQTETDLLHTLDVSQPQAPALAATAWMPGGALAVDGAQHCDNVVLLHWYYGLTVNDAQTLDLVSRFEPDLPESNEDRSYERFAIDGDTAHLAVWGYGLISVDLSDPANPVEIGRMPFPFASVVAIDGDYAYLTKNTNGPLFGVADLSDPTSPTLVWQADLPTRPHQVAIHDGHLFLAEYQGAGDTSGGLRIFDLADPAAPVQVGRINDDCGSAFDLTIDTEVSLAYVACNASMQVIDIEQPESPVVVGHYDAPGTGAHPRIAQQGDRVWYGDIDGLHQIDVSDPTAPALIERTPIGRYAPQKLQAMDDGRLLAVGGRTGTHVFAPGDGGDAIPLENGVPVAGLEGEQGEELLFSIEVAAGADALQVLSYGGRGDVDMLVRHGQPPTADEHDAGSSRPGNNQTVRIANPAAGRYYIKLTGNQDFNGVSLQARY